MADTIAIVEGGGDVGSAVALALWRAGWGVVVCELPRPTVLRRQLSVAEAAFSGRVVRDGVAVVRGDLAEVAARLARRDSVPLVLVDGPSATAALAPAVVVDARFQRGVAGGVPRGAAPLVVGLGPGLRAGEDVDVVVETLPGPELGRVYWEGATRPHTPLPAPRDRARAEQFVRASAAGLWRTERAIGDLLEAGALLGTLDGAPALAPVDGCLRGLVHDAVPVPAGQRLAAVHPGDWARKEAGIAARAAAIAAQVVALAAPLAAAPARAAADDAAAKRTCDG